MNKQPAKPSPSEGQNAAVLRRIIPYIIAIFSFFAALSYNDLNHYDIATHQPPLHKLDPTYGWIRTADDASYLRPAENFYHKGEWKDNNPGRQSYFVRTPGYGLFRYSLMRLMGFETSYHYFMLVQLILFAVSVLLLYYLALLIGLPHRYALIVESIYGLTPFACGFLYYSITEAITPALMIGYTFFLLSGYRRGKPIYFVAAALLLGYIGLTRPLLLLFGAGLPLAIYWSEWYISLSKKMLFILLTGLIALAPIGMWALRSAHIAGEYVGIYPIYYPECNSQFRPTHQAIWEFQKSFGTEGYDFHQFMVPLWRATMQGDTSPLHIDSIMMDCPAFVKEAIGEQRLRKSYTLYRQSVIYQRDYYPPGTAMPDTIPAIEREVIKNFQTFTSEINSKHWLWCHIAVPLQLFKSASFHSNLSMYMFQHSYRGRWWMEAMRVFFLILHFLCCLSFIGILFFKNDRLSKIIFGVTIGAYFFYLCYIFRGLEERYTLPILPLMLLTLFLCIYMLSQKLKKRPIIG
jgi:hypothetical protein